jgi:hypothetical protein
MDRTKIEGNYELFNYIHNRTKSVNGCWEWQGAKTRGGYGHMAIGKNPNYKYYRIHRLIHAILYGETKLVILHSCDNPPCCNPHHLNIGTMLDNVQDMDNKFRRRAVGPKGMRCHLSKLKDKDVIEILNSRKKGTRLIDLANKYKVTMTVISCIANGKTWNHITGLPKWKNNK